VNTPATGRGEEEANLKLRAVPNPATGDVQLLWSRGDPHGHARIAISDAAGRELKRYRLPAMPAEFLLPLAGYASGTYFITLTIGQRNSTTRIVVR
jgi:hypothetical protein